MARAVYHAQDLIASQGEPELHRALEAYRPPELSLS